MNRVMQRARETDGVFAVMMVDLDKFKSINDRFGHDAGDAVLREFSRRLQENIRGVDLVARFGGEEFFVAMPDVDQRAAAHAAERIRRAIEDAPVADARRRLGFLAGRFTVPDDFDRMGGVENEASFEGGKG